MNEKLPAIDPNKAILLVMDYQPGILSGIPHADELLERMARVIAKARENGLRVGYVRVAFKDNDYEAIPKNNLRFKEVAKNRRMHADAPETAVHSAIAPEPGDIVVRKTRVGAFSTTDLDEQLRSKGIDTLILAGLSTSGVVLSTVRDASDRDYALYVLEDGSADGDPDVHAFLTQKVLPRQAHVISTDELFNLLEAK